MTLNTLDGWREFATSPDVVPTDIDLDAGKNDRLSYHSRFILVPTPEIKNLIDLGYTTVLENRHALGSPRGLIVSGPASVGKTTALTQFGRAFETADRASEDPRKIPVVYVSLMPRITGKRLSMAIARFLGLPFKDRDSLDDVSTAVTTTLRNARTAVVLVDEAHHLVWGQKHADEASDHLKALADASGATFVLGGIDLTRSALVNGPRSAQTARRFRSVELSMYGNRTKAEHKAWRLLVTACENGLRLRDHEPGTLVTLADDLHDLTSGSLGSLLTLVRQGAIKAILNERERLDATTLKAVRLDIAAVNARPRREGSKSKAA